MKKKSTSYFVNVVVIIISIVIVAYICINNLHLGNVEFTDNAQIKQHVTPINSRVQGYIKEIRFEEYQNVNKGDTLVIIEDVEYRLRVAQAEADYQKILSGKSATITSLQTAQNNILVSDANIQEAKVKMENAENDFNRYELLLSKDAVTREQYDNAKTNRDASKAHYDMLVHKKQSTSLVKDEHKHHVNQSDASIKLAETILEIAQLNLSYTVIIAPSDGVMGRKNIQSGQLIQQGQTLVNIVDKNEVWITANYKESQVSNIVEGNSVEIKVDAFPDVKFNGFVKSMSDATGSSFSLIPQDNSAGNFVKVQQRIPIRIEFSKDNDSKALSKLRAGMNVDCLIRYKE